MQVGDELGKGVLHMGTACYVAGAIAEDGLELARDLSVEGGDAIINKERYLWGPHLLGRALTLTLAPIPATPSS